MGTGRAALIVFAVHVTLLFFPPIPPLHKGSLWSYALGYLTVGLALAGASEWGPRAVAWWARERPFTRWRKTMAALVGVVAVGWTLRMSLPDTFARFSREEGAWEPVTLFVYGAAALLILRRAAVVANGGEARVTAANDSLARHLKLVGAGFAFLTLEEIDYFGILGGMIGRIDGIYFGSVHDLIMLAKAQLIPGTLAVTGGVLALAGLAWLLRSGYLQPRRIASMTMSMPGVWMAGAVGFQVVAAAEEAGLLGVSFGAPSPEELIEMLGAICLAGFALEVLRDAASARETQVVGAAGRPEDAVEPAMSGRAADVAEPVTSAHAADAAKFAAAVNRMGPYRIREGSPDRASLLRNPPSDDRDAGGAPGIPFWTERLTRYRPDRPSPEARKRRTSRRYVDGDDEAARDAGPDSSEPA